MRDLFEEIYTSISKNKLRTFLTGFSIAWGIFMLIVLLASGNGLKNGMSENFNYMSKNSLTMWPGRTSTPYKGMQKGRNIKLEEEDVVYLKNTFPSVVGDISPVFSKWGQTISYGKEYTNSGIQGVYPDQLKLGNLEIASGKGRFINLSDLREERKVVVIHKKTADVLFRNGKSSIGEYVKINAVPFRIIGEYINQGGGDQNPPVYIPFTTANSIFNPSGRINSLSLSMNGLTTEEETKGFIEKLRERLGAKHQFDPKDQNALWIWDRLTDYLQTQGIFNGINLFVWIIGIGTLIAGVVGISNIMLITVKERTHEFGIRKALGATPISILSLVLVESIVITAVFGYIGMIFGVGLTELINYGMEQAATGPVDPNQPTIFKNPTVNLDVIFAATAILIIAGLIAGYVPAKKAVSIKPIDALRGE